jgi:DNA-binding NarL/FixJ family response regulator
MGSSLQKGRIFILEWRPIVLEFFDQMFKAIPTLGMVGSSGDPDLPLDRITVCKPDIVITDLFLHNLAGIRFVQRLQKTNPRIPVLVYSMSEDPAYALMALDAGARGFTLGTRERQQTLIAGIQRILAGDKYLGGGSAEAIASVVAHSGSPDAIVPARILTPRELMVFHLIGKGMCTREIAQNISITPKTVLTHRTSIMRKLGVRHVSKLMLCAFQWSCRQNIE